VDAWLTGPPQIGVMQIPKTEARKRFAEVIRRGQKGERVKVTHYGRTQAAIVSKADLEKLEDCERAPADRRRGRSRTAR
jgi:prevent-host-death family protein